MFAIDDKSNGCRRMRPTAGRCGKAGFGLTACGCGCASGCGAWSLAFAIASGCGAWLLASGCGAAWSLASGCGAAWSLAFDSLLVNEFVRLDSLLALDRGCGSWWLVIGCFGNVSSSVCGCCVVVVCGRLWSSVAVD